jgi:polar amino acid transport system substrate-binding protein
MWSRILGWCLLAAVLGAGCTAGQAPPTRAPVAPAPTPPLRIGMTPNYPPLVFKREGTVVGVEADFATRLGQFLQQKIEMVELPWAALIPALQQGRIDIIMSGMSVTPERERTVLFAEPYLRVGQMAIIRARDVAGLGQPSALYRGHWKVGYEAETTGARFVQENLRQSTGVAFPSADAGLRALRAGQIDVFIHDAPTAWRIAEDRGGTLLGLYTPLTVEHLAWAVRKFDTPLRQQLNAALSAWRQDGSLQAILDRWIKVQVLVR